MPAAINESLNQTPDRYEEPSKKHALADSVIVEESNEETASLYTR
jgi:hypothetical protein